MLLDRIPTELRERTQWVVWKRERRKDKWTKVPYRVDARTKAEVDDPRTWGTLEQAVARAAEVQGIGYVFSADDPFTGVDLDACIDPQTGELHPDAAEILISLGGYQERSPSGHGMHAIVIAKLGGERHRTGDTPWAGVFEVYDQGRFFTVTGNGDGAVVERQAQLDAVVARLLPVGSNGGVPRPRNTADRSLDELLSEYPQLAKIAGRKGKAPRDPSQSGWDWWLTCQSVEASLTDAEIEKLIRHGRPGDPKLDRDDYIARTIARARDRVETEQASPMEQQISRRWGLRDDPITAGEMRDPIVYLTLRSERRLRLPNVDDLFDAAKHTRIVSRVARTQFEKLTAAEAVKIAQQVIALCAPDDIDPQAEAREWVTEFITHAGAVVEALNADGTPKTRWDVMEECQQAEQRLENARSAAGRSAIIHAANDEWCLPAGALKAHSGSRMSWPEFTACLGEIGFRHADVDVRAPGSRADRAAGRTGRIHRNFYVGAD